jgi:hypothetical protein
MLQLRGQLKLPPRLLSQTGGVAWKGHLPCSSQIIPHGSAVAAVANHYRISPKFWLKARQRGWSDAHTTFALYLLTCEHRTLEGLYRLPRAYMASDLGWPARKVDEALAAVAGAGFAVYDDEAEVVLIPKALKHQAPSTENHVKGAMSQLERLPRTCLWHAFRMACSEYCPKLGNEIEKRWPSDGDATSRTHEGARGVFSSSTSSSISTSKELPSVASDGDADSRSAIARRVFAHWQTVCQHPTAKFTGDRRSKVEARLREGFSEADLIAAVDGAARAPFVNDQGKTFDDLELICRTGSKVEGFMKRTAPSRVIAAAPTPPEFSKYDRATSPEAA